MNRRELLKFLGLGLGVIATGPILAIPEPVIHAEPLLSDSEPILSGDYFTFRNIEIKEVFTGSFELTDGDDLITFPPRFDHYELHVSDFTDKLTSRLISERFMERKNVSILTPLEGKNTVFDCYCVSFTQHFSDEHRQETYSFVFTGNVRGIL